MAGWDERGRSFPPHPPLIITITIIISTSQSFVTSVRHFRRECQTVVGDDFKRFRSLESRRAKIGALFETALAFDLQLDELLTLRDVSAPAPIPYV